MKIEHAELLRDKSLFIAEIPGIDLLTDKDENAPLHSLGIHLRNSGERTAKSGKGGSEVLKVLSLQLMDKAKTDAEILRLIFQTDDKGTTKSHSLLMPIVRYARAQPSRSQFFCAQSDDSPTLHLDRTRL